MNSHNPSPAHRRFDQKCKCPRQICVGTHWHAIAWQAIERRSLSAWPGVPQIPRGAQRVQKGIPMVAIRLRNWGLSVSHAVLLVLLLATPPIAAQTPQGQPLDAADLLERIEQMRAMSLDTANWQRQQAASNDSPAAALDLLLLDLFGPQSETIPVDRTQARLHRVVTAAHSGLTTDSRQLLRLLAEHIDRVSQLQAQAERLNEQLDIERRAHQETRQKLDALRRIDQEIGARSEPSAIAGDKPHDR